MLAGCEGDTHKTSKSLGFETVSAERRLTGAFAFRGIMRHGMELTVWAASIDRIPIIPGDLL